MDNIRYGYFQVKTSKKTGFITCALERPGKECQNQTHRAAFSFCSPKDEFRKKIGRNISSGRLSAKKVFHIAFEHRGNLTDAFQKALQLAVETKLAPNWVERGMRRKTIQFGLTDWQKSPQQISFVKDGHKVMSIQEPVVGS